MQVLDNNKLFRDEIELIPDAKFFADAVDAYGFTPLICAAGMGMVDVVDKLLSMDVDIDYTNKFGHTAFTWACSRGRAHTARLLLFKPLLKARQACITHACTLKALLLKLLLTFYTKNLPPIVKIIHEG